MNTHNKGQRGEQLACRFLRSLGYAILHTNWRAGRGEIDIIAKKHHTTIFIEVKTRLNNLFGSPEESITPSKIHILRSTISRYLAAHPCKQFRVDVIALERIGKNMHLRHLKDIDLT